MRGQASAVASWTLLQESPIPATEVRGGVVRALQEAQEHRGGIRRGPHRLVRQDKFAAVREPLRRGGADRRAREPSRCRHRIGIELGPRYLVGPEPETGRDQLVEVRLVHHMDVHVRRAPAGIRWPAPSGKARAREIESAPEELWRARLSEKVRAELVEDELRLDQSGVEPFYLLAVVRADGTVLQERDRGRDLDRHRHDVRVRQAEPGEAVPNLPVEVRDRHGGEWDG